MAPPFCIVKAFLKRETLLVLILCMVGRRVHTMYITKWGTFWGNLFEELLALSYYLYTYIVLVRHSGWFMETRNKIKSFNCFVITIKYGHTIQCRISGYKKDQQLNNICDTIQRGEWYLNWYLSDFLLIFILNWIFSNIHILIMTQVYINTQIFSL